MKLVFADASFWIGLRDLRDQFHASSVQVAKKLLQDRVRLLITPLVFAEVHAQFCRGAKSRAQVIRDCWENPVVRMEQASPLDQEQALEILRAHGDKTYSFCDAVSFAVMLRLGIRDVVTFDDHFRQFGQFTVIDGSSL
jgi:predicted nucleic acid-binding protein